MLASILAFLQALPQLLAFVKQAQTALGPNWPQKMADISKAYGDAAAAKTDADRAAAVKEISAGWSS